MMRYELEALMTKKDLKDVISDLDYSKLEILYILLDLDKKDFANIIDNVDDEIIKKMISKSDYYDKCIVAYDNLIKKEKIKRLEEKKRRLEYELNSLNTDIDNLKRVYG